ncbi:PGF-CTERM sorting domain-containing protein [Natronoarchaeum mannanilyticum]|uniref:PGF-CTERM sorting domain-containing protein n=1 Tax=Natronoarchaeum mannanilyticum TaxID=926360 RepID=A0AAV3TA71_9EURY
MQREKALVGAICAVIVVSALAALLVPGVLASDDDPGSAPAVESSSVSFTELTVQPADISGATATFAVDARLEHRGGAAENLSIEYRAVDEDTGMVETTVRQDVPDVSGDREVSTVTNVSVARQGDYRLETIVYRTDRRIVEGHTALNNVGSLTPAYADTPVDFHRFGSEFSGGEFPVVEYSVEEVSDDRAELDVSAYLTNTGDDPESDLRVVLLARQSDSNVIADRKSIDVETLGPGRSATPEATLTVADDYNYYLDAVLWRDGSIVGNAREPAQLDPTREVGENTTEEDVEFRSDDFSADDGEFESADNGDNGDSGADNGADGAAGDAGDNGADAADSSQPGFGVAVGVAALVGALIAAARRGRFR